MWLLNTSVLPRLSLLHNTVKWHHYVALTYVLFLLLWTSLRMRVSDSYYAAHMHMQSWRTPVRWEAPEGRACCSSHVRPLLGHLRSVSTQRRVSVWRFFPMRRIAKCGGLEGRDVGGGLRADDDDNNNNTASCWWRCALSSATTSPSLKPASPPGRVGPSRGSSSGAPRFRPVLLRWPRRTPSSSSSSSSTRTEGRVVSSPVCCPGCRAPRPGLCSSGSRTPSGEGRPCLHVWI